MATRTDLEAMINQGEQVLWRGKPQKKCFIFESIFNPLLPFALIWAIIDFSMISAATQATTSDGGNFASFILLFFAIHLMPVWIYIGGVLMSFRRYKNTEYIITDRGIYISGGVFTYNCQMKPFAELSNVNIHRGIFDQMFGVGDVILSGTNFVGNHTSSGSNNSATRGITISDIAEYQEVFSMVKQLQTDIYADTMYPNDLRPGENHGYQTQYKGRM